jgi:hypothetical protein
MSKSDEVGRPTTPLAKPNLDVPKGTAVQRQEVGGINSPNAAGGEVPVGRYGGSTK